jgi:uncharacterized membrane protein
MDEKYPQMTSLYLASLGKFYHGYYTYSSMLILSRNYVAVAADTFSSELGILAKSPPRLILAPWRTVPKGTNGGVTPTGLLAGTLGAFIISVISVALTPFCTSSDPPSKHFQGSLYRLGWTIDEKALIVVAMTAAGLAGSLLDSILGAIFQASVVDRSSGKIVEGIGGRKVILPSGTGAEKEKAKKEFATAVGWDILSNNGVNVVMAASIAWLSMYAAGKVFGVCIGDMFE